MQVRPSSSVFRLSVPASTEINRLVTTANAPEMAMPCPAMPSVTRRVCAIGVSRLTGMNSEAIRAKTHSVMAKTPLQRAGCFPLPVFSFLFSSVLLLIQGFLFSR